MVRMSAMDLLKSLTRFYLRVADEAHVRHWWGSQSYSVHVILQEFYEGLRDKADSLAELISDNEKDLLGDKLNSTFEVSEKLFNWDDRMSSIEIVNKARSATSILRNVVSEPTFNTLLDEINLVCKSAIYKLRMELGEGKLNASDDIIKKIRDVLKYDRGLSFKIKNQGSNTYSLLIDGDCDADILNKKLNDVLVNEDWFSYVASETDSKIVINIERMIK